MDRQELLDQWDELWKSGLWAAPLSKAVEDLTPGQASWKPDPAVLGNPAARVHSIWQQINHILFWREVALRRTMGGPAPSEEEVASRNWDAPEGPLEATESNWSRTRQQLADSQQQIHAAIADPGAPQDRLRYLIGHDSYHLGQIMSIRALMGLPPIE
ncbi:MAG: DinB family protein [Phycisphaerales bacterium]